MPSLNSTDDSDLDSSDMDDPTAEYVKLQLRIASLTTYRMTGDATDAGILMNLKKRAEVAKKHYFFDERSEHPFQI